VLSYSQVSVTNIEADSSRHYFNVTCPVNADPAIVEQTWSSTGSDYVEGYGCQCRDSFGAVTAEVIVDALTSTRGNVKCLSATNQSGEPKLHTPTSIAVTAPVIKGTATGSYFKVICSPNEPSAYEKASYTDTVERMTHGSSIAYLPADGCTCHYKSGAVVTEVQINLTGQHQVNCVSGTGNGDWATLKHDPKVLKETLLAPSGQNKFLRFDCASKTVGDFASVNNPESYSEGMGCICMDASGYVSSQLVASPSESATLGKYRVHCVSDQHAQVLEYPRRSARNPEFADQYLDVYCTDGDKSDVVGTSTIPGAEYYSDLRSVWFYKQNGAMAIMEATQDKGLVSAGYNKQIQLNTKMVKKSEKNKYRDLIRNGGIATAEMPASVFEKRVKAKADSCKNLEKNRTNMKNSLSARTNC
jgi:hypothetical protein